MRGFEQASTFGNQHLTDMFLSGDQADEVRAELKLKRIQFDSSAQLSEKLENVCSLLDCSKRVFLEMAVWEAIEAAEKQYGQSFEEAYGCDLHTAYTYEEQATHQAREAAKAKGE